MGGWVKPLPSFHHFYIAIHPLIHPFIHPSILQPTHAITYPSCPSMHSSVRPSIASIYPSPSSIYAFIHARRDPHFHLPMHSTLGRDTIDSLCVRERACK